MARDFNHHNAFLSEGGVLAAVVQGLLGGLSRRANVVMSWHGGSRPFALPGPRRTRVNQSALLSPSTEMPRSPWRIPEDRVQASQQALPLQFVRDEWISLLQEPELHESISQVHYDIASFLY